MRFHGQYASSLGSRTRLQVGDGILSRLYSTYILYIWPGSSPTKKEEQWRKEKHLDNGTSGTVWLEKFITENDGIEYRAVKEIKKDLACHGAVAYSRELETIAKFSHQKV